MTLKDGSFSANNNLINICIRMESWIQMHIQNPAKYLTLSLFAKNVNGSF